RGGTVRIAVPKEVKKHEYRVALTPAGTHELVQRGHQVVVEAGAGTGSAIRDEEYVAAGGQNPAHCRRHVVRGRHRAQGQGTDRRGVRPAALGAGPVHLPAPGRGPGPHRGAAVGGNDLDRVRDGAVARRHTAPPGTDVRGGGPARTAGRRVLVDA